jgi:hypothetical protein
MSHIAEEYAKSLGCRIGTPVLEPHFFPVTSDKYITFHTNGQKVPAKHYDFWGVVFLLIKDRLKKDGIDIIQTGGPDDPPYPQCDHSHLGCSFKQMSYVIKNAELHLGIDSLPMHIASAFNTKIVALFSNLYIENAAPLWSGKDSTLLSPDFSKTKPSFSLAEKEKRINEIKPEEIASAVFDMLGIVNDLGSYKTLHLGSHYSNNLLEVIPDFIPDPSFRPSSVINLRCDYDLLSESLPVWLSRQVNIMTSKKINTSLIASFKDNIAGLTLFLEDGDFSADYLKVLNQLNIRFNLICRDKEKLSDFRLEFFDWTVEEYSKPTKKDIDFESEICHNTFYHSNKTLISKGKEYSSKASWLKKVEKTSGDEEIIDSPEFWEEIEHLNIYNYGQTKKE